jgi:hypothetical protein
MFVDGITVIIIARDQTLNVPPLRQHCPQHAGFLHGAQSRTGARQVQEMFPLFPACLRDEPLQAFNRIAR